MAASPPTPTLSLERLRQQPLLDAQTLLPLLTRQLAQSQQEAQKQADSFAPRLATEINRALDRSRQHAGGRLDALAADLAQAPPPAGSTGSAAGRARQLTAALAQQLQHQSSPAHLAETAARLSLALALIDKSPFKRWGQEWQVRAEIWGLASSLPDTAALVQHLNRLQRQAGRQLIHLQTHLQFNLARFVYLAQRLEGMQTAAKELATAVTRLTPLLPPFTAVTPGAPTAMHRLTVAGVEDALHTVAGRLFTLQDRLQPLAADQALLYPLLRQLNEAQALLQACNRALYFARDEQWLRLWPDTAVAAILDLPSLRPYRIDLLRRSLNPDRADLDESDRQRDLALVRLYALELATGAVHRHSGHKTGWWQQWRLAQGYQIHTGDALEAQQAGRHLFTQLVILEESLSGRLPSPPPSQTAVDAARPSFPSPKKRSFWRRLFKRD